MGGVIIGTILTVVILVGIYRFNFTNDDIYVEQENGEVVKYDDLKKY